MNLTTRIALTGLALAGGIGPVGARSSSGACTTP